MKQSIQTKLFILGIFVSSLAAFPFILDPTLTPRFITLAIILSAGLFLLYKAKTTIHLKIDLILFAYSLFTLFNCLSVFWSHTKSEAIFESSKQVMNLFVFLITYLFLKKDYVFFLSSLLKISVVLFILIFSVALFQILGLENFDKESIYNITSLHGHKNLVSSFLFLNLFFLILAIYKLNKRWKPVAIICIVISLGLLFFLRTKAVWLGSGIALTFSLSLYLITKRTDNSKLKINFVLLLIVSCIFLNIFFLNFLQPFIQKSIHYTSQMDSSGKVLPSMKLEQERLILWDKTYHLIKQKPLLGLGMGNWQIYLPDATLSGLWRGEDLNYTFQRPHNDFLWILSELGLLGFNLFLIFLLSLIFLLISKLQMTAADREIKFEILLCLFFISGYYILSFFDFPRERIEHGIWINIILGFGYYLIKKDPEVKFYFKLNLGKNYFAILTAVFLFISFIGLLRFKGEFFMRRMLIYKSNNQFLNVVNSGNSAKSFVYTVDATSVPVSWYTGNAKAALGKFEDAQKDFISAFELTPYNKNVLNDLGSSYVYTNDVMKAKFYYKEAARISPRYDEPKLNLASIYINAKDFKTASFWLKSLFHDSERRKQYEELVTFMQQP